MEKKQTWFVKTWNWNKRREEYEPKFIGYFSEEEARKAFEAVPIGYNTTEVSLFDDTNELMEKVECKVLMVDNTILRLCSPYC